jgi:hypothetical protein
MGAALHHCGRLDCVCCDRPSTTAAASGAAGSPGTARRGTPPGVERRAGADHGHLWRSGRAMRHEQFSALGLGLRYGASHAASGQESSVFACRRGPSGKGSDGQAGRSSPRECLVCHAGPYPDRRYRSGRDRTVRQLHAEWLLCRIRSARGPFEEIARGKRHRQAFVRRCRRTRCDGADLIQRLCSGLRRTCQEVSGSASCRNNLHR